MAKYDQCVLFTRVGGFYELYLGQAERWGPTLNLKVAQRKTTAGFVSMSGFPFFHLSRYLKIVVEDHGMNVAISEEYPLSPAEKVKGGGLIFGRKVVRVVSPGTLVDEDFLDPYENNFILSISPLLIETEENSGPHKVASGLDEHLCLSLAWIDVSTGVFYTQESSPKALLTVLARVSPRELIVQSELKESLKSYIAQLSVKISYSDPHPEHNSLSSCRAVYRMPCRDTSPNFAGAQTPAAILLLNFINQHFPDARIQVRTPVAYEVEAGMIIDRYTMKALELKETFRHGLSKGSLLHAIRRTATQGGARLLSSRLANPSTREDVINQRLAIVTCMLNNLRLHETIVHCLGQSVDVQRLLQKFLMKRATADDIWSLSRGLSACSKVISGLWEFRYGNATNLEDQITARISSSNCDHPDEAVAEQLLTRINMDQLQTLIQRMEESMEPQTVFTGSLDRSLYLGESSEVAEALGDMPIEMRSRSIGEKNRDLYGEEESSWIMKKTASHVLQALHKELDTALAERPRLTLHLQETLQTPTLSLRWTPALGYIGHLRGRDVRSKVVLSGDIRVLSSSKSTKSLWLPQWVSLGSQIEVLKSRIRAEEQVILSSLCADIGSHAETISENGQVLDEIDVACSFAQLAKEQSLVRPIVKSDRSLRIINGRHLVVDNHLRMDGRSFLPNDCLLVPEERVWLVTGPNMGGKSTFLRQNALIIILAQMGAYVPADYAEIGIVDKLFTRVSPTSRAIDGHPLTGAHDRLAPLTISRMDNPPSCLRCLRLLIF